MQIIRNLTRISKILTFTVALAFASSAFAENPPGAEQAVPQSASTTQIVVAETVEVTADQAPAEELKPTEKFWQGKAADYATFAVNNLWICIAAALVFIMHLGFACVESGLTQSKNTTNILFKNVFIICVGMLTYAAYGFNSMYPGDNWTIGKIFALGSPIANSFTEPDAIVSNLTSEYNPGYTYWGDFIFQAMFAATAATIVSGAVAERVKLAPFMIGATLLVTFIYPITGSWQWGGGWLKEMGFADFAGSTLVHAFGGYAALAAVLLLGPRRNKYLPDGKIRPILGHSMPLATIGVFMLFLGWYGFNGGSVLSAEPVGVSHVFVTTSLAGAAGGVAASLTSWVLLRKPDLSMALNGILAGLVGITAGADAINPWPAILVGIIAGILVVISVLFFDKIKIDDPVGAISVHGVCGNWGTVAVGIFGGGNFGVQLLGTVSISLFAFLASLLIFGALKAISGIRVSPEEEEEGLDVGEHGQQAYPDFMPNK
ncbi:MAG: ammonium transporter [Chthoniobacterales bacterium]|nr:ammonium transporter [Chthoniobacterales bacterium]